jgi:hypothetical protein
MSSAGEVVAVGSPRFTLHTLGWRAFQDLCAAVLREVWGQSVQAFADSNDGGRDGAFYGTWQPPTGPSGVRDIPPGPFVLQCKHTKTVSYVVIARWAVYGAGYVELDCSGRAVGDREAVDPAVEGAATGRRNARHA